MSVYETRNLFSFFITILGCIVIRTQKQWRSEYSLRPSSGKITLILSDAPVCFVLRMIRKIILIVTFDKLSTNYYILLIIFIESRCKLLEQTFPSFYFECNQHRHSKRGNVIRYSNKYIIILSYNCFNIFININLLFVTFNFITWYKGKVL